MPSGPNALEASGRPVFFPVEDIQRLGLGPLGNRRGRSVRVWARSLGVMQKEAIVQSAASGRVWRLASDEGPYLNGHDFAPCPLSFMTVGMISSYLSEITALARERGIDLADVELTQHNHYTMEGSARDGTMRGGALPVELDARIASEASDAALERLLADAVRASPVHGLLAESLTSLFTLTRNGVEIEIADAERLGRPAEPDAGEAFERLARVCDDPGWVEKRWNVESTAGVPGGAGSSLAARQSRTLHLEAACRRREDGAHVVEQKLLSPLGSTFAFVCDEPAERGGRGAAPDAPSYVSAGIAFCFMTQLGRYAKILRKRLDAYGVVQDTHLPPGGAPGASGAADPVETHVHLVTEEDDDFARAALRMGEQTCFLHALCRTPLETRVQLRRT